MSSFHFRYDQTSHSLRSHGYGDAVREGNEIMTQNIDPTRWPDEGIFNDLDFYRALVSLPGCVRVELAGVTVIRNNFVLGIETKYRLTMEDGTIADEPGPQHLFENGHLATGRENGSKTTQSFALRPGESLVSVLTMQGGILDALELVTSANRRHYFGGFGGYLNLAEHADTCNWPIVAFAGTYKGVMHRIGYYKLKPEPPLSRNTTVFWSSWRQIVAEFSVWFRLSRYSNYGDICGVCQEPMGRGTGNHSIAILRCDHAFHVACLTQVDRCPLCREAMQILRIVPVCRCAPCTRAINN